MIALYRPWCNSGANTAQSERGSPSKCTLQVYYWVVCKPHHAGNRPSEVSPLFLLSAHQLLVQWRPSPPHSELLAFLAPFSILTPDQVITIFFPFRFSCFISGETMEPSGCCWWVKSSPGLLRRLLQPWQIHQKAPFPLSSVLTTMIIVILAVRRWDTPSNPSKCIKKSLSPPLSWWSWSSTSWNQKYQKQRCSPCLLSRSIQAQDW